MKLFLVWIISFCFVYLLYFITVITNKKKLKNFFKTNQAKLIIYKFKLDEEKLSERGFANALALSNSFLLSTTLLVTEFFKNYYIKILIALITIFPLMILVYFIIGKIYKKKEGK